MINKYTDIRDVARFVIFYFKELGEDISPIKLQKLLYYVQSWHLVYFDKHPLFAEEPQAYVNGPVYTKVYSDYRDYFRQEPIRFKGEKDMDISKEMSNHLSKLDLGKRQEEFMFSVLNTYGKYSDISLVTMTHSESPWIIARTGLSPFEPSTNFIKHSDMFSYYEERRRKKEA